MIRRDPKTAAEGAPVGPAPAPPTPEPARVALTKSASPPKFRESWEWRCPKRLQPIFDTIWPHVYKPTCKEKEREKGKATRRKMEYIGLVEKVKEGTEEDIEAALGSLEKVEETELDRRRSIESRLTSVLGMTSISTALFGALISLQAKLGDSKSLDGLLWPAIGASTYGMTQLLLATRAAVNGLKRRPQIAMGIEDYLPAGGEIEKDRKVRTAKELVGKILDDEEINCRRADQMEVAHVALRNFLVAMLLLAVFWPMGFLLSRKADSSPDTSPAIREILSSPILLERLRGPAGPVGPPGPSGNSATVVPDPKADRPGSRPPGARKSKPKRNPPADSPS